MEFRLLGPLEVRDGARTSPLGGPKRRTVLVHLVLRPGQLVPADRLIEEVWGGEPPDASPNGPPDVRVPPSQGAAFGAVHRAFQPQVGRDVAVKMIHHRLAGTPEFIRRFEAEAQLVARLEQRTWSLSTTTGGSPRGPTL